MGRGERKLWDGKMREIIVGWEGERERRVCRVFRNKYLGRWQLRVVGWLLDARKIIENEVARSVAGREQAWGRTLSPGKERKAWKFFRA